MPGSLQGYRPAGGTASSLLLKLCFGREDGAVSQQVQGATSATLTDAMPIAADRRVTRSRSGGFGVAKEDQSR